MREVILKSEFGTLTALGAAARGQKIAVICRARFDAQKTAEAVWGEMSPAFKSQFKLKTHLRCIQHASGGVIEFCWLESNSQRRADDFDHVTLHATAKGDAA